MGFLLASGDLGHPLFETVKHPIDMFGIAKGLIYEPPRPRTIVQLSKDAKFLPIPKLFNCRPFKDNSKASF